MAEKNFDIFTDGGASGNPGPAGIGVVIKDGDQIVLEISESIGDATNNVAEYKAVIAALEQAVQLKADGITIHTDSELLFFQLTGSYKVKNEVLLGLFNQVRQTAKGIKRVDIKRIPREQNSEADRLAKKAILKQQAKVVAAPLHRGGEESPSSKG